MSFLLHLVSNLSSGSKELSKRFEKSLWKNLCNPQPYFGNPRTNISGRKRGPASRQEWRDCPNRVLWQLCPLDCGALAFLAFCLWLSGEPEGDPGLSPRPESSSCPPWVTGPSLSAADFAVCSWCFRNRCSSKNQTGTSSENTPRTQADEHVSAWPLPVVPKMNPKSKPDLTVLFLACDWVIWHQRWPLIFLKRVGVELICFVGPTNNHDPKYICKSFTWLC